MLDGGGRAQRVCSVGKVVISDCGLQLKEALVQHTLWIIVRAQDGLCHCDNTPKLWEAMEVHGVDLRNLITLISVAKCMHDHHVL
jgi:hypothetical protein